MAFDIAYDLEAGGYSNIWVGGISYDFANTFDIIPLNILFAVLERRGLSDRILGPVKSIYQQLLDIFGRLSTESFKGAHFRVFFLMHL